MIKKRILGLAFGMLCLPMVATSAAYAEGMEVTIIGGPEEEETTPVTLDDIQLNKEVTIDGYATLLPTEFEFADKLGYYRAGLNYIANSDDYYQSGQEADFALVRMDVTNLSTVSRDFLKDCEIKVVYDDVYEYGGWFYQSNYDNEMSDNSDLAEAYGEDLGKQNERWAIGAEDNFKIDPMYKGHYIFGCTLPNSVVQSKDPLRMEIKLGGNDITYNIRK